MSYEQSDRLDRHSSDRNSNAGVAGIARDAYDSSNSKWNWNLNTQDTASGALPSLTLSNGSSGEGAAMQNAGSPGQNAWAGSQGEGSWIQNAVAAGENPAATFSGGTGDAGTATAASAQAAEGQAGNQQSLPVELQQLEAGIQQQLQQLAREVAQLQADLGTPSQTTGDTPATPSQTASNGGGVGDTVPVIAPASPESPQTAAPPAESTPVASTSPQPTAPTEVTPVASTPPQPTVPTTDATIQALQISNPQAAQLLTAMEPATSGMTQAGFNQYESNFNQNIQGGQYPDVASAANAAAAQLQSGGDAADATTATNVINANVSANGDATLSTYTPPASAPPAEAPPASLPASPPAATVPPTGGLGSVGGIEATVNGFFNTSNGDPLNLVGLDASPEDAVAGFANVQKDFPGLTAIRLNVNPSDTNDPDITQAVQEYTGAGIAVELEVHDTNGDGSGFDSTYEQWAQEYKNNPLVMLETPNEPSGSTVASDQAQYIEEIRAQGFNNPIGIQPVGGYDESNIPTVLQDLQNDGQSTSNLYVTPHIYYGGTDPNGAMSWAQEEVSGAQQNGLPALIDEYGPAMNGYTMDPEGETVNAAMYSLDQTGYGTQKQVGSIYWGMDNGNHTNGADSAFLTPDGSQLTSDGQLLQQTILS